MFPQGVPEADFTYLGMREPTLGRTVNDALAAAVGCPVGSTCELQGVSPNDVFAAVTQRLRDMGLCAGRHDDSSPGGTDEIAVARRCTDAWEGYHIYAYTGFAQWSPASYRGDWSIKPVHCGGPPPPAPGCPSSMFEWRVKVYPQGHPYEAARLDFTPYADPNWCRQQPAGRLFCPVSDHGWDICCEKVVGGITIEKPDNWSYVSQHGENPMLFDFAGFTADLKVCSTAWPRVCAICRGVDDAGLNHDHVTEGWEICETVQ